MLQSWAALELRQRNVCTLEEISVLSALDRDLNLNLSSRIASLATLLADGTHALPYVFYADTSVGCAGRFEWVDGVLVRAVKQGGWLLLDNANLCADSVLDRLNALLEPGGLLLLNESGVDHVVAPHPDFRLFFTADEQYGILSVYVTRCLCYNLRDLFTLAFF
jgi:midasin (ATPase involved in ribosome maturation)